jgi:hypothetical protein
VANALLGAAALVLLVLDLQCDVNHTGTAWRGTGGLVVLSGIILAVYAVAMLSDTPHYHRRAEPPVPAAVHFPVLLALVLLDVVLVFLVGTCLYASSGGECRNFFQRQKNKL